MSLYETALKPAGCEFGKHRHGYALSLALSPLVGEGSNAWIPHFLENVAGTDWMFTVPESYVDGHRSGFSNSQASPGE